MAIEEQLINNANNGDSESAYKVALEYRAKNDGKTSLDTAIKYFEIAATSRKQWILNDYALALVERAEASDLEKVITIISELCAINNSQSIRIMGLCFIKKGGEYQPIGECLLNYSSQLNNKWATYDLINIRLKRKRSTDRDYILSLSDSDLCCDPRIACIVFKTAIGGYGMKEDYTTAKKVFTKTSSDTSTHLAVLEILKEQNNEKYAKLIELDYDNTDCEIMIELAKMYRDGIVVKKSKITYDSIVKKLPEKYKLALEKG